MSDLLFYDLTLSPVSSHTTGLSVSISDRSGTIVATPSVGPRIAGFGAIISYPDHHDIYVRDHGGTYAATHVTQMNGAQSYRVDLVLLPRPITTGSGPRAALSRPQTVRAYLTRQVKVGTWTEIQAMGVAAMAAIVQYGRTRPAPDNELRDLIDGISRDLWQLGLDEE